MLQTLPARTRRFGRPGAWCAVGFRVQRESARRAEQARELQEPVRRDFGEAHRLANRIILARLPPERWMHPAVIAAIEREEVEARASKVDVTEFTGTRGPHSPEKSRSGKLRRHCSRSHGRIVGYPSSCRTTQCARPTGRDAR
jgi:hypothetical protein